MCRCEMKWNTCHKIIEVISILLIIQMLYEFEDMFIEKAKYTHPDMFVLLLYGIGPVGGSGG